MKVLLLKADHGEHFVCDEYYPTDYGRVHVIPQHKYGQFNRDDMTLDLSKVAFDIIEIVYEGDKWPVELTDRSPDGVLQFFGVSST